MGFTKLQAVYTAVSLQFGMELITLDREQLERLLSFSRARAGIELWQWVCVNDVERDGISLYGHNH
ncbi:MAG: hypothetical protein DPW18_17905 [Chloroflexi bacterium]|nr:hypothetical protein [Chloroflexota bacterium]